MNWPMATYAELHIDQLFSAFGAEAVEAQLVVAGRAMCSVHFEHVRKQTRRRLINSITRRIGAHCLTCHTASQYTTHTHTQRAGTQMARATMQYVQIFCMATVENTVDLAFSMLIHSSCGARARARRHRNSIASIGSLFCADIYSNCLVCGREMRWAYTRSHNERPTERVGGLQYPIVELQ